MKIIVARTAGFCMGVRRAVDMVLDAANQSDEPVCTYGPLIHNPQVLEMLKDKGIDQLDQIPEKGRGIVLIRAHGVPPSDEAALKTAGFSVVNATCPRVTRVQTILGKHASLGYSAIIVGDKNHPEVVGLSGYTKGLGHTVSSLDQIKKLPLFEKAVVVAQTTQNKVVYDEIKEWCKNNAAHYKVFDTICGSTRKRQTETRELALKNDAVIVVGGKQSGNTRRLAQVAAQTNTPAFLIEDVSELDFSQLASASSIGITAGASTPNWIILDTLARVKKRLFLQHPILRWIYQISGFVLRTNLLLAAGAAAFTLACCRIQGASHIHTTAHFLTTFFYILAMQILNRISLIGSDKYNCPERAAFYEKYKSWFSEVPHFFMLLLLIQISSKSFVYGMALLLLFLLQTPYRPPEKTPECLMETKWWKAIEKNFPGGQAIFMALAWATVCCVFPVLFHDSFLFHVLLYFLYITGTVFSRAVFFDILAIQGDRIAGKETLPTRMGEKKSFRLIQKILLMEIILVLGMAACKIICLAACILLAAIPILMLCLIHASAKGRSLSSEQYEWLIDGSFLTMAIFMTQMY